MAAVIKDLSRTRKAYSYYRPRPAPRIVASEDEMASVNATINLVSQLQTAVNNFSSQTVDNSIIWNEILTGSVDGSNKTFYFASKPTTGKVLLFVNGVLQENNQNADYQIVDNMLTLTEAPAIGSKVMATYAKA